VLGQVASLLYLLPRVFHAGINDVVVIAVIVVDVRVRFVLFPHRMPSHAIWFTSLRHAPASGDLPGFIRSHD
jgi:hypothetical protein